MRKTYFLRLAAALMVADLHGQDSTAITTLQEVVISASRTEQPLIEVPRSVTVITEETIRNSVYQSVGELLNSESGLFVVGANQSPGTNQNIFMRGANSNQVAVLVDGVRITDPSSPNAAIDFSEISLTNVERIEVLRGSHSTQFGGAAVGGVINIITKKSANPGVHGVVSWQGGTFGRETWSSIENVNLSYGAKGGLYANASLMRQDVSGLDAAEKGDSFFTADRDDFRKTDAFLNAGFKNSDWDISASFKQVNQYTEIDDGAFVDDDNSYLVFDRRLLQYTARYRFNPSLDLSVVGSFSNSERFYEDDSSQVSPDNWDHIFSKGTYYGKLQTHEAQLTYSGERFHAVLGAGFYGEEMFFDSYLLLNSPGFRAEYITNYDSLDTRTSTMYSFASAGYALGKMDISAGARISRHSEAGTFANFELSPSYSINDFLFYGSLTTGFNPPSLYQLYDPSRSVGAFATRGNSALEPERSVSVEAGVKKQFQSGSHVTFAAYQTNVKNGVEYVNLWNGSKSIDELDFIDFRGDRYINVGEQRVRGVEVEGRVYLSDELSLAGNFSMIDTQVRATPGDVGTSYTGGHHVQLFNLGKFLDEEFRQEEVVRRPAATAFVRLAWQPLHAWRFEAAYRFTGRRYDAFYDDTLGPYGALSLTGVDAYHLIDLQVNWRASKVISASIKAENILDENYREVIGFQTRGRGVYLKLTAQF